MKNTTLLNTTVALLTGASGGIGRAIAEQLCQAGATVVLVGRNQDTLSALAETLKSRYRQATLYPLVCDLAKSDSRLALMQTVEALPVKVNLLINNAGVNHFGWLVESSEKVIAEQLQVNALYPLLLTRQFLQYAAKHGQPTQIINIGSTFGSIGYPGFAAYSASKFALRGASEALAREYGNSNVRIRYFAPRATSTSLNSTAVVKMNQELGVAMDAPEAVAKAFLVFLQGKSARKYLGWPEKLFVTINQILPTLVSRSLAKALPTIRRFAS